MCRVIHYEKAHTTGMQDNSVAYSSMSDAGCQAMADQQCCSSQGMSLGNALVRCTPCY